MLIATDKHAMKAKINLDVSKVVIKHIGKTTITSATQVKGQLA